MTHILKPTNKYLDNAVENETFCLPSSSQLPVGAAPNTSLSFACPYL
ncbi:hypothetical protein ACVMIH_007445 [Bradyrhizobium sp. USDA 4503]